MTVLVAFESKNGSTADVAEAIAARLRERGLVVEVEHARDVCDPQDFSALVVGAPIYSGRWLTGAHKLLRRLDRLAPEQRPPLAIFALGPRVDEGPENWERPRKQFAAALAKHPSLAPVSSELFGGADPPKKRPRRDIRDWEAIGRWAGELAGAFGER